MSLTKSKLDIFAPAKVNLYLHLTGRLDNGYHTIDSLIAFADVGDRIAIEPAEEFEFHVTGPFANAFSSKETDASPHSANLVVQAAWALARAAHKTLNVRVTLEKKLPLAAGIGGGSADAAALLWGLIEWWGLSHQAAYLPDLMTRLGADVPVCFSCKPARVRGMGEKIETLPSFKEIPVVLMNPGTPCPTADVFRGFDGGFKEDIGDFPDRLDSFEAVMNFLDQQQNSLSDSACALVPEISDALETLKKQKGCTLARLSGSGATCLGLFEHEKDACQAAGAISSANSDWWVISGWLGRPERY